jgi:hypothetical protein
MASPTAPSWKQEVKPEVEATLPVTEPIKNESPVKAEPGGNE